MLVVRRDDRLRDLAERLEAAHGIRTTVIAHDLAAPDAPAALRRALDEGAAAVAHDAALV